MAIWLFQVRHFHDHVNLSTNTMNRIPRSWNSGL